jgi:hypothetical protein
VAVSLSLVSDFEGGIRAVVEAKLCAKCKQVTKIKDRMRLRKGNVGILRGNANV